MAVTAVLDIGKTNVKLVVFQGAAALWQRSMPNVVQPGPPYPHEDMDAIHAFLLDGLREAAALHSVDTILATTHGAALALVDRHGPVLPVMDYEFTGPDELGGAYRAARPPFAQTYSPRLGAGLNLAAQAFWQQARHPDALGRAEHMLMLPQFIAWRLTGVAVSEATSLGCHTDLWEPDRARPSTLVEAQGWARLIPPLVRAWESVGPLRPEVRAATSLGPEVRVLAGIHDSNASLLPHLLTLPAPFTLVSTGTWVVIMALGGSTARLDAGRDMLCNVDATGRPVPTARFMGGREVAAILDGASPEADEADLAAVLEAGVLALPAFAPQGGPYQGRTGRIEGALPDRPGARAALAALYAALLTDDQIAALGMDEGPIVVEGSFAANPLFCATLAGLRPGQPVLPAADTAGTAYGASLLATWPQAPERAPLRAVPGDGLVAELAGYRARWRERVRAAG